MPQVTAYKGIRYAAPPVGALRWRPPQAVADQKTYEPSNKLGPNAPQRKVFNDIDAFAAGQSEDCLFLNVWTRSAGDGKILPVLFYIHGGGFAVGFGGEQRYDGTRLATRDIVVVTMNYRLNALGLLPHPALTEESGSSGNFAMLDLVEALKWVKRNISKFGGDPDQVTIAGESAGSMFVSMLMASPLARGLFHRAIGESGGAFPTPERPMLKLADAHAIGERFAAKLGAKTAADLRAASVEKILDAHPGIGLWPLVDGHVLTETPKQTFARGAQADVPLLAGWNSDEGMNFKVSDWPQHKQGYEAFLQTVFGRHAGDVLAHYPKSANTSATLGADLIINQGTWAWLEAHRKTARADVFRYRFDHGPNTTWFPNEPKQGAFHSCEIPYFMDNVDAFDWKLTEVDHKLAKLCADYVANFVKTGNPNGQGLPNWPNYRDAAKPLLIIRKTPVVTYDPDRQRFEMLDRAINA